MAYAVSSALVPSGFMHFIQRDGPTHEEMTSRIDDAVATFTDDTLDRVLLRDRRSDETEEIARHARLGQRQGERWTGRGDRGQATSATSSARGSGDPCSRSASKKSRSTALSASS